MVTETRLDHGVLVSINTCTKQMVEDVWYSAVRCWRRAWQGSWFVTDRWNIAQRWSRTCHNPYRCSRQWLWRRDWTSTFPRILDAGIKSMIVCLDATTCRLRRGLAIWKQLCRVRWHNMRPGRECWIVICHEVRKKLLHAFILKLKWINFKLL